MVPLKKQTEDREHRSGNTYFKGEFPSNINPTVRGESLGFKSSNTDSILNGLSLNSCNQNPSPAFLPGPCPRLLIQHKTSVTTDFCFPSSDGPVPHSCLSEYTRATWCHQMCWCHSAGVCFTPGGRALLTPSPSELPAPLAGAMLLSFPVHGPLRGSAQACCSSLRGRRARGV